MKKPVKIVLSLAATLLTLAILGLIVAVLFADSIARKSIQAGGTYALGVETKLDSASIGLVSGNFGLTGLKVANPAGFDGDFLNLGKGSVAVSLGTLMQDTVELPRFQLADVVLDLERNSKGANYQIILDNLKKLDSGQKPPATEDQGGGKKFKIKEVSITNVTVHLDLLGGPAGSTKLNIPIHEIKLTNVGNDGSGVDIPKLTSILLEAILAAAVEKGGGLIPADVLGDLKGGLSQLSGLANVGVETVGKLGEQATKIGADLGAAAQDLGKGLQDVTKDLGKGLGGLLPPAKKKDDK